jgi:hypothetical protein
MALGKGVYSDTMGTKQPSVKPLCQWVKTMAKFSPEVMARAF